MTTLKEMLNVSLPWSNASVATVGGPAWTFFSALCWLSARGVARLFGPGTSTQDLVDYIRQWFAAREQQDA